jgi:hypothetical protein
MSTQFQLKAQIELGLKAKQLLRGECLLNSLQIDFAGVIESLFFKV